MAKPKIFVSFDFEKDRQYTYTLNMWNSNPNFEFTCDDRSPSEIQTESVSVVKNVLSRKINEAAVVVVIIGEDANRLHKDWREIGYRNWQNYEIAKAKELRKRLVAVQISSQYEYPEELRGVNATRVYSFTQDAIIKAVRGY